MTLPTQQVIFFRNVSFTGAAVALFGAFVAFGDDLRFALVPALFGF